jgi:hypothetical protein
MFERITLDHPGDPLKPIDLGVLAECLVFYKTVRVIVNQVTFPFLVRTCGAEELLDLMAMGSLQLEYIENMTGVLAKPIGGRTIYDVGNISSNGLRYQVVARKLFDDLAGPSGKGGNKQFNRFARFVKPFKYDNEMAAAARADWIDPDYTRKAAKAFLSLKSPHYVQPEILEFRTWPNKDGVELTTNIDFDAADAAYRATYNISDKTITPAYLLSVISDTRRDLTVASAFGSEFAIPPAQSVIAACKFNDILNTASSGKEKLEVFQVDVLDDLPNIRDAVNSGARTYSDVVRLVEQAARFKDWIGEQDGDGELRKSYLRDVMHVDWADNLPPKALRWLIFNAAGMALGALFTHPMTGTIASNALSAADTFILDKLIKGWKPNHFIDGPLKGFVHRTTGIITQ